MRGNPLDQRAKCVACSTVGIKKHMVSFGLRWACDNNCAFEAERQEREREAKRTKRSPNGVRTLPSRQRKQAVIERDGHRCRRCGTARDLHVHHIKYRSEGGGHTERNLITLCLQCHDVIHSNKRHWKPVLEHVIAAHYELGRYMTTGEAERIMGTESPAIWERETQ